jgi:hypothetical protein
MFSKLSGHSSPAAGAKPGMGALGGAALGGGAGLLAGSLIAHEWHEHEEKERLEKERLEKERLEKERLEKERRKSHSSGWGFGGGHSSNYGYGDPTIVQETVIVEVSLYSSYSLLHRSCAFLLPSSVSRSGSLRATVSTLDPTL